MEQAEWFILFLLPLYVVIAGAAPSVLRACGMIMLFFLLKKLKQDFSTVDTISIIFILLILYDKFIVYHVGFQLSFAVTIGLLLSKQIFELTSIRIFQVFQISFIAQMMILPLQIHYFFQFNPLSIILNVLIVPYFSIIVIPLMFILAFVFWLPKPILLLVEDLFLFVHKYVMKGIQLLDMYAFYPLTLGTFPIGFAILYYLLLFSFLLCMKKNISNCNGC